MNSIQRLEILEKRAEIAQIKEVLTLHQTPVLRLILSDDANVNELYDRLSVLEDEVVSYKLRLI